MSHKTVEEAKAHIDRMVKSKGAKRDTLFIYPDPVSGRTCKWCHGWHVGHTNVRHRQ